MGIRLYIGNLPLNVSEVELREHFSTIGPLSYLSIPTDRETGKRRGFAFVEFKERPQAEEAIRRFNNHSFHGRIISVSEARAKDERPRPAAPTRPSLSGSTSIVGTQRADSPGNKPSRDFGPDKPSRRDRGKAKGEFRADRGPKGPMREIVGGRFFGEDGGDDEDYYDEEGNEDKFEAGASGPEKGA
ncbi:MAG: RNA-binding protein [Chloracidobacterium sp.]|nr:RNA-binding protein [Chloracidobacterium sp.]